MEQLNARGVPARHVFYPANHQLTCYRRLPQASLPVTERIAANCIVLPVYSDMREEEVLFLCDGVRDVLGG